MFPELALAAVPGPGLFRAAGPDGAQTAREPAHAEFAVRWGTSGGRFASAREVLGFRCPEDGP